MSSLDLTRFLPPRYRDKAIDTLLKSAFNRHLTQEDSIPLFGYVGDRGGLAVDDVKITERDMERQLNQLVPMFRVQHGTEKKVFSWPDLVQKLQLLGVDYKTIGDWFQSKSYNFAPPIDLDKFCNFNQYFWLGPWLKQDPDNEFFVQLGIPNVATYITPLLEATNPDFEPDYYVIQRGNLSGDQPLVTQEGMPSPWSPWSYTNLWVHRADAMAWVNSHSGTLNFNDLIPAIRPIIEYDNKVKVNLYHVDEVPADSGSYRPQVKFRHNQPPLFDIYENNGTPEGVHTGYASSIFFYQESPDAPFDEVLARRVVVDSNGDFIFGHSLVHEDGALFFYKFKTLALDTTPGTFTITGAEADLSLTRRVELTANSGSIAYTGFGTKLIRGHPISLTNGTYSITGFTLGNQAVMKLNALPHAFSTSGSVLDFGRTYSSFILSSGTFTINGNETDLVVTTNNTFGLLPDTFDLLGYDATLIVPGIQTEDGQTLFTESNTPILP